MLRQSGDSRDLVTAIGTGAGEKFNYAGLRYGKIILLMDADADGYHISTLMLDFFFRHMPELIKKGHVYIAQPPLYRIDVGKETYWARDDEHKEEILAGLRANAKAEVTRFKGLGEMDAKDLARRRSTRKTRTLLKVEIESLLEADNAFVELLGKDAEHALPVHHGAGRTGRRGRVGRVTGPSESLAASRVREAASGSDGPSALWCFSPLPPDRLPDHRAGERVPLHRE